MNHASETALKNPKTACSLAMLLLVGAIVNLSAAPIIIDHTSVKQYSTLTDAQLGEIKKYWLNVPGESHSAGYRNGVVFLENLEPRFVVETQKSETPMGPTNGYLRVSSATWGDISNSSWWIYSYGEEDWYTTPLAIEHTKGHLEKCNTNNFGLLAMGFVWCWDSIWHNDVGGGIDPVHQVRWAGSSEGGPDGDQRWGLDAEDTALTGNRVCMDTYLNATQQYDDFCKSNGWKTRVFFTTGAIDSSSGESGYQQQLKYDHIRKYVSNSVDAVFFDYADILAWSDSGEEATTTWTDYGGTLRRFQKIHPDNMLDFNGSYTEDGDHIGQRGALRLGKALWYMLSLLTAPEKVTLQSELGTNGLMKVRFTAKANSAYVVEFSTDLISWQTASEVPAETADRVVSLEYPIQGTAGRFYRAQRLSGPQ